MIDPGLSGIKRESGLVLVDRCQTITAYLEPAIEGLAYTPPAQSGWI